MLEAKDLQAEIANAPKGTIIQGYVDAFFAGLEARTTNLLVQGLLKGANTIIDMVLTQYGL